MFPHKTPMTERRRTRYDNEWWLWQSRKFRVVRRRNDPYASLRALFRLRRTEPPNPTILAMPPECRGCA